MVGIVAINYPDSYVYQPYHVTLLVIAVAVVAILFNTFLAQKLPMIEGIILIVHVFGFFGILIPLWVLSPTVPPSEVFGSIEDRGGWGNNGLSCLVGLIGPIYALIGRSNICSFRRNILTASQALTPRFICVCICPPSQNQNTNRLNSRGDQRRISCSPLGHGLDADPQWLHWLRHDCYTRVLRRRHRQSPRFHHRLSLHPGLPELHGISPRSNRNDNRDHDYAVLCCNQ